MAVVATAAPIAALQQVGGSWGLDALLDGTVSDGQFGYAMDGLGDVDGDGHADFAISSRNFSGLGAVRVFSGRDAVLMREFLPPNQVRNFGFSVANAGDVDADGVNDIVIGAPDSAYYGSHAFVYSIRTGNLIQQFAPVATYNAFGWSVDGVGDLDRDGHTDIAVGDHDATVNNVHRCGAVYVFSGSTGAELFRIEGTHMDEFVGTRVSGAGDLDGDGLPEVLVAADGSNLGGIVSAGAVFVLSGASGAVLRIHGGAQSYERFGSDLDFMDDLDGDGIGEILVGAPFSRASGLGASGRAEVLSGASGAPLFNFLGRHVNDWFGSSVAAVGDADGDGVGDALVGAVMATPGVLRAGAAYLISGRTGEVVRTLEGTQAYAGLGSDVSGAGDVDGDGVAEFLVSEPYYSFGYLTNEGRAFLGGFDPLLTNSVADLSASLGGNIGFQLDFGAEAANTRYQILVSGSGTGPTRSGGLLIPLTADAWFFASRAGRTPPLARDFSGVLGPSGRATAELTVPPNVVSSGRIGSSVYFAALAADAVSGDRRSSVAVIIGIRP